MQNGGGAQAPSGAGAKPSQSKQPLQPRPIRPIRPRKTGKWIAAACFLLVLYAMAVSLYGADGAWVGESVDGIPYLAFELQHRDIRSRCNAFDRPEAREQLLHHVRGLFAALEGRRLGNAITGKLRT